MLPRRHSRHECRVPDCIKRARLGEIACGIHMANVSPDGLSITPSGVCLVESCDMSVFASEVCAMHGARSKPYNLSVDQIVDLWRESRCQTCGTTESLNIDHDHACCPGSGSCGKCVRGLLCRGCNFALGAAKDSTQTLQNMISYLKRECI